MTEHLGIGVVDLLAVGEEIVDFAEAAKPHERLKLVHLGVRADVGAAQFAVNREIAKFEKFVLERGVLEDEQPALARMKELRRMEGEHGHGACGSDCSICRFFDCLIVGGGFIFRRQSHPERVRGVVDDRDAVLLAQPLKALDVAHVAVDVNRHNRFGDAGLDERLDLDGIETQRPGVDIGKRATRQ